MKFPFLRATWADHGSSGSTYKERSAPSSYWRGDTRSTPN